MPLSKDVKLEYRIGHLKKRQQCNAPSYDCQPCYVHKNKCVRFTIAIMQLQVTTGTNLNTLTRCLSINYVTGNEQTRSNLLRCIVSIVWILMIYVVLKRSTICTRESQYIRHNWIYNLNHVIFKYKKDIYFSTHPPSTLVHLSHFFTSASQPAA
jgi:hypothetical protein